MLKILLGLKKEEAVGTPKPDRIYTINLDDFACSVCSVVDHYHSCAGEAGMVELGTDGFPDKNTIDVKNINGWVVQLKVTDDTGKREYEFMGVEGRSKQAAISNARRAIDHWNDGMPVQNNYQIDFLAEYHSESSLLSWDTVVE